MGFIKVLKLSIHVLLLLLCVLLLVAPFTANASRIKKIPRLSVFHHMHDHRQAVKSDANHSYKSDKDFKTVYYTQTLDHFNYRPESYSTFQQRCIVNSKYWGGGGGGGSLPAPIFAYLGEEAPIDQDIDGIGFLSENAARFKALMVYIEHRYYGESVPFGSREVAMKNASTKGYFNSAQALADYAEVLISLKKNLSANASPVIVVGGSYGGMLAAWFRLKYPHIALGALASSAPVLYLDDLTPQDAYYSRVSKDFKDISENCYNTIKSSWSEIDRVASQSNGLSSLGKLFKSCKPVTSSFEVRDYLEVMYAGAAQYDSPPKYPVTTLCKAINAASQKGTDVLGRIIAGMTSIKGEKPCYDLSGASYSSETKEGWAWQSCSEIVMNIGISGNDPISMFPASPFDLKQYVEYCNTAYGVPPRPHWITSYYGGYHIKKVLKRFGSNIIFSNGLRDPYSTAGVLEDISKSIVAIHTKKGSHCLDIVNSKPDDPKWLVMQRNTELKIINRWIQKYYKDLLIQD